MGKAQEAAWGPNPHVTHQPLTALVFILQWLLKLQE